MQDPGAATTCSAGFGQRSGVIPLDERRTLPRLACYLGAPGLTNHLIPASAIREMVGAL